jgi:hypothetical protein
MPAPVGDWSTRRGGIFFDLDAPGRAGGPHPYQGRVRPTYQAKSGSSQRQSAAQLNDLDAAFIDPKSYRAPGAYWTWRQSHDRVA